MKDSNKDKQTGRLFLLFVVIMLLLMGTGIWYNHRITTSPIIRHERVDLELLNEQIKKGNIVLRKALHYKRIEEDIQK